jgi:outer membrane protein, adhesin transport system
MKISCSRRYVHSAGFQSINIKGKRKTMLTRNQKSINSLVLAASLVFSVPCYAQNLRQAVRQALRTNPDVQFDTANRLAVEEELKQAKAGFFPTVEARFGIGRESTTNPTAQRVNGESDVTLTRREASIELRQNVFDGGANFNETERQRSHLHSAAYKLVGTAEDTALKVSESYINVLRYQHGVKILQRSLRQHDRLLAMIRERSDSGLGRKADFVQAQGRMHLAHANLVAEQAHLRDASAQFMRVVGYWPKQLRAPVVPNRVQMPVTKKAALLLAHRKHPTLKSISADVAAAEAQHRTAKSFMFPRLDVVLGMGRNKNLDGIVGINHDNYLMLRGTYTLYSGGKILARHRETIYRIQEANEVRNRTIMQMDEHVRLSWNAYHSVKERIKHLLGHKASAKETLDAYQEQFKNRGDRTLLDVLDSLNEYYRATIDCNTAHYDELYARLRILNATGSLLHFLKVSPPNESKVPESPAATLL